MRSYQKHFSNPPNRAKERVSLRKLLKSTPSVILDDHGEPHEAAALIKSLHRSGGERLNKRNTR
jgi:hypothetical protein